MPRELSRQYGNDVVTLGKTRRVAPAREPDVACGADSSLRSKADGIDRLAFPNPRLDHYENDKLTLAGNQVDLAQLRAIAQARMRYPFTNRRSAATYSAT